MICDQFTYIFSHAVPFRWYNLEFGLPTVSQKWFLIHLISIDMRTPVTDHWHKFIFLGLLWIFSLINQKAWKLGVNKITKNRMDLLNGKPSLWFNCKTKTNQTKPASFPPIYKVGILNISTQIDSLICVFVKHMPTTDMYPS